MSARGYAVVRNERLGGWAVLDPGDRVLAVKPTEPAARRFLSHHLEARAAFAGWWRR